MTDQILAFLINYQDMRQAQKDYFKTKNKGLLIRSKQLELDLDKRAAEIKAALELK